MTGNEMQQQLRLALMALAMTGMLACGDADVDKASATLEPVDITTAAPTVLFTPDNAVAGKPSGPITVSYRIIGKAVVGRPVAVELRISSSLGNQTMKVAYRTNDPTALRLAESEPRELSVSPAAGSTGITQQVTVIPMREGRLFLNVSVSVETENGSMSTVTAIPIQVGEAPRAVEENGRAMTDENGEAVRALPAQE
ncbi:MAG: hypothetical protein IID58_14260 [Proteobacteria bacterium]|nr:hypothetical protein [Pseudomonadota bacterium]